VYFDANLDTSLPLYIGQVTEWTYYTTTSIHWTMDRMGMLYHYQYYIGQWTEGHGLPLAVLHWTMDWMDMSYHYQYILDNGQNGHAIPLPVLHWTMDRMDMLYVRKYVKTWKSLDKAKLGYQTNFFLFLSINLSHCGWSNWVFDLSDDRWVCTCSKNIMIRFQIQGLMDMVSWGNYSRINHSWLSSMLYINLYLGGYEPPYR